MLMATLGYHLSNQKGFTLRSGRAKGADQAFESEVPYLKEIFTARDATPESFDHAAKYHPAWEHCSAFAQALHARNSMIVLGRDLNDPVDFVVCWTPGGAITGGTGQALRIAGAYGIPVFNYGDNSIYRLSGWLVERGAA